MMEMQLDNTAIIHSAVMKENYINVFRIEATLKEMIDLPLLQEAADRLIKEFPLICSRLTKNNYWFGLESVARITVKEDIQSQFSYLNSDNVYQQAMVILYKGSQISVEFFHSVTDGYGALYFLKTLIQEYLHLKYHICPNSPHRYTPLHTEDSFIRYAQNHMFSPKKKTSSHHFFHFQPSSGRIPVQTATFSLPVLEIKERAHHYHTTVTVYMTALTFLTVFKLAKGQQICLMIPLNLRQLFPSLTLRNFSYFALVTIHEKDIHSLESLIRAIENQLHHQISRQYLIDEMTRNVSLQKNPLIEAMPLSLKKILLKYGHYLNNDSCMTISNLGVVQFEDANINEYIESMNFILSPRDHSPYNCGIITCNDKLHISITHTKERKALVKLFEKEIKKM